MWTLALTLDKQLDSALRQFKKWGVDFIMTDFIDRDDQKMINFYERIAKACAEQKIMIMYHGAHAPKGFNRTYPNAIGREGVLGSEYSISTERVTPKHNLILPFTRMLAGPFDYEPGFLNNANKKSFRTVEGNPISYGTRCHQLAMFVVYDSPIQIFSGNPSQGYLEPAFMDLLGSIPTGWDETKIIEAKVGEYIVSSRKKNNDWYIAGMNNWNSREQTIKLDFLDAGEYSATVCTDGINAEKYAADYTISQLSVNKTSELKIKSAPGGGFLLKLIKTN
jgi:alpha-glucosidase